LNILSYSLWGDHPLYWRNIPLLIVANEALFPRFVQYYHVHESSVNTPIFPVLEAASEQGVRLVVHKEKMDPIEMMLLRISPLWNDTVENVFPRDLDSIPTTYEARAVRVFVKSGLAVHAIRGCMHHDTIMGGLCGFNKRKAIANTGGTFDSFLSRLPEHPKRGDDQHLILTAFVNKATKDVLDSPFPGVKPLGWECQLLDEKSYDQVKMPDLPKRFLDLIDRDAKYPGAVVVSSKELLEEALKLPTRMAGVVGSVVEKIGMDFLSAYRE
jgi:hypothetical protein